MKKQPEQLELFDRRPMAEVLPFPPAGRAVLVRTTADALLAMRRKKLADGIWRRTCKAIIAELAKLGTSEAETRAQLLRFRIAVEAEIARRRGDGIRGPGAA